MSSRRRGHTIESIGERLGGLPGSNLVEKEKASRRRALAGVDAEHFYEDGQSAKARAPS